MAVIAGERMHGCLDKVWITREYGGWSNPSTLAVCGSSVCGNTIAVPRKREKSFKTWAIGAAIGIVGAIAIVVLAPRAAQWFIVTRALPSLADRYQLDIAHSSVSVSYRRLRITQLSVRQRGTEQPFFSATRVEVRPDWTALLHRTIHAKQILLFEPMIRLHRYADGSTNVAFLRRKERTLQPNKKGARRSFLWDAIGLRGGRLTVVDDAFNLAISANRFDGVVRRRGETRLSFTDISGKTTRFGETTFKVARAQIFARRDHPQWGPPVIKLERGHTRLPVGLTLSAIDGVIRPNGSGTDLAIGLAGSYGGATAKLWEATGHIDLKTPAVEFDLKAKRFGLNRIASILQHTPVIAPKQTMVSGELSLRYTAGTAEVTGALDVSALNLFHPAVALKPLRDLSGSVAFSAHYAQHVLTLSALNVRFKGVEAALSGVLDRRSALPVIDAHFSIAPVACRQLLAAVPPALAPQLQGFRLRGSFATDIQTHIDYAALDDLTLTGSIGINRCKVIDAPDAMRAERFEKSFVHTVQPAPHEFVSFEIGSDDPDFTPYEAISSNMIAAVLTTEDGAFFRHHGFITSQFRKALARNLTRGGFRLGASTITMQTVKNVMLSQEKTLARKLQEMFLTWYIERRLSKERLMEIYLNAIEFGPYIYGIGRASRHYFGKHPAELMPLEAAFFATMLPNPRGRYRQYCHGALSTKWDKRVRRVLKFMESRGHVPEGTCDLAADQEVVFSRDMEALSETDCLKQIDDLLDAWKDARADRMKDAVSRAAPHQLQDYVEQH